MKKITFKIGKDGNIARTDAIGFGHGCMAATQDIEKLLGQVDESSRAMTDNYFQDVDPLILKQDAN